MSYTSHLTVHDERDNWISTKKIRSADIHLKKTYLVNGLNSYFFLLAAETFFARRLILRLAARL